ncbi:restriction endonuclease subunit S [Massilia sp. W12]|uniref:restriction endonuclease subunit S n=1 Tax=Massilia sp. W12 TaxID=3126507 RepID=UPI0030D37943
MSGWPLRSLAQCVQSQTGLVVNARKQGAASARLPYLSTRNVQQDGLDLSDVGEIALDAASAARARLQSGDVLLLKGGSPQHLGRSALWRAELAECLHQNHLLVLRCGDGILPEYLLALLQSAPVRAYFQRQACSSTRLAHLTLDAVLQLRFILPPLAQQQNRCAALLEVERQISLSQEAIQRSRELQQALRLRLLQAAAQDWPLQPLGRLCRFGGNLEARERLFLPPFRYIEISDLTQGGIRPDLPLIQADKAPARARRRLQAGAILLGMARPELQRFARVGPEHADCIASTAFAVLLPQAELDGDFLFHTLFAPYLAQQMQQAARGGTIPALNQDCIAALQIALPPLARQVQIARAMNALFARLQGELRELACLQALQQRLLQDVLPPLPPQDYAGKP